MVIVFVAVFRLQGSPRDCSLYLNTVQRAGLYVYVTGLCFVNRFLFSYYYFCFFVCCCYRRGIDPFTYCVLLLLLQTGYRPIYVLCVVVTDGV